MPACPPTPAAIVNRAEVRYPDMAREQHVEGTSFIKVDISPEGKVEKASVKVSAGNGSLDSEAIKIAKTSTYKAATEDCKPAAASYVLVVDFKL